jgi:hypothetical protein
MVTSMMNYPSPGRLYKHYKGGIFMAPHTETGETLVIYKSILFGSYYARPLDIWNGETKDGVKRFEIYNG